jgi:hypothetical protein
MSASESAEHKKIKDLISEKLKEWIGASIREYPSSGHELDVFAVTLEGISIYVEIIWSDSRLHFFEDMNMLQQSDAEVKLAIASPAVLNREEYQREFAKVAVSQRRIGVAMHGDLIDGTKLIQDEKFLTTEFKDVVLSLVGQMKAQGKAVFLEKEFQPSPPPQVDKVQETLMSNLFIVKTYPSIVFSASTNARSDIEVFREIGRGVKVPPFVLKNKKLYTFTDLRSPSLPFLPIVSMDSIGEEQVSDWLQNGDKRKDLIRLMNLTLKQYCVDARDLAYDRKHRRFVCTLKDGKDNIFRWRPRTKTVTREVANRVYEKNGELLYCKHYSASLRFIFIGNNIFLKIEPTFTFTKDGYNPFRSEKLASLMSRWISKQYNKAYLNYVRFWAIYLSKRDIVISIPAGTQKVEVATTPMITRINIGIAKEIVAKARRPGIATKKHESEISVVTESQKR